jgi:uncharacterized protein YbjT (DUF2867 family)
VPGVAAIAVFGASGRTGQALIAAARARGIAVHALYRQPGPPAGAPEGLTPVHGDLRQPADVERTLEQTQAAACVFGPNREAPEAFCAEATAVVLGAMAATGVRRLVCQTGAMIGDGAGCRSGPMEWAAATFARRQPALAADRVEQESLVMSSDRDWLIVKPPRLSDRSAHHRIQVGPTVRVGMLSSIGRTALADLLLAELVGPNRHGGRVFVKSPCRWLTRQDQEQLPW